MSVPFFTRASEFLSQKRHVVAEIALSALVALLTVGTLYVGLAMLETVQRDPIAARSTP